MIGQGSRFGSASCLIGILVTGRGYYYLSGEIGGKPASGGRFSLGVWGGGFCVGAPGAGRAVSGRGISQEPQSVDATRPAFA